MPKTTPSTNTAARTIVVNYHFEDYDALITRRTPFGNQHPITKFKGRTEVIALHFQDMCRKLVADPLFHDMIMSLEGKRLGCVCRPMDCHGDLYVSYINTVRSIEASFPDIDRPSLIKGAIASMRAARQ